MRKFILLLSILFTTTLVNAQVVEVSANAGTSANPALGTSNYVANESIYTETEVGASNFTTAGTAMNRIALNVNTLGSPTTFNNVKIYFKDVPLTTTTFTSGTYTNAGYTLVFDGSVTFPATGWTEFALTTPYVRASGTNLQMLIERTDNTPHSGFVWICANGNNTSSTINTTRRYNSTIALSGSTSLAVSAFRQAVRFLNRYNNDASVKQVYTMGKLPLPNGTPQIISANISNDGINTLTNLNVTLNITGANTFTNTQVISSLASGASTTISFAGFTPTVVGTNTVTVSVPSDDFNDNNSSSVSQFANKNTWAYAYGSTASAGVGFNGATGDFVAKFNTNAATAISHVSVNFFSGGQPYKIGVWDATGAGGTPGTLLYETSSLVSIAGSNLIPLSPSVNIAIGNFYVGVRQTGTTNVSFAYQTETPIRSQTFYFTSPTGGTTWTDFAPANSFRFMIEPILVLTGGSSITWDGSIWDGSPTSTTDATIASSTAPASFSSKNLTINSGVTLTTTGITATVNGNITNDGNGIAGTGGLTIAANSTITGNAISFNGVLTVNSGATLTTGGLLILSSNASNTARVANSAGSISGNVTVERYIPAKRAWRLLTAPLGGSNTSVYNAWQNAGNVVANTGIEIYHPSGGTGIVTGGVGALNGNLRTYNTTNNTWTAVTNTQSTNLFTSAASAANNAFLIFPTAPYGGGNIVTGSTITTLKATGALQTGTQTFNIPDAAFSNSEKIQLIGNPYASPVDFNLLTRTNVTKRFWAWDPQLSGVGGYVLVSDLDDDNTYTVTPGGSTQTQHIQSGQAFFVEVNNTGASLTFNEDDKSSSNINTVFRTGTGTEQLSIDMINPNDGLVVDGILAEYNNNFSNGIAAEDGQKLFRSNENFYLTRNTKPFMLEGRKLIDNNDTLFLTISGMQQQAYRFAINGSNFANDANLSAYLKDKFLGTETAISLSGATEYNFAVTADNNSKAADRFMVVFRSNASLPVTLTNVKAYQQNSGINVEWNTQSESGMLQYEVEKSANGTSFTKVNTTAAKSGTTNSYGFFDATPFSGANYYRIKAISLNGDIKYSSIVVVKLNNKGSQITLYPNPVKGSTIQLQLNNVEKGNYSVTLFNQLGQQVMSRTINHIGGSSNQTIEIGTLASGVYELRLSNGNTVITQKLIKE